MEHENTIPLIIALLILLALARVLGELMERIKQPAMIGEIMAGILLGPSVLKLIPLTPSIHVVAEIGIFLLIIIAGMEVRFTDVLNGLKGKSLYISFAGFFIPIILGYVVCMLLGLEIIESIFISMCVSITALPISIRILMDMNKLQTEVGKQIISVAIFNDVVALTILGIVLDVFQHGQNGILDITLKQILISVSIALLKVMVFLALVYIVFRLIDRLTKRKNYFQQRLDQLVNILKSKESLFAITMVFILLFASLSEVVGLHFIVGAFFGSMLLSHELLGKENFERVEKTTSGIAMGFLAPIFFATLGLEFQVNALENWVLIVSILLVSFFSKIFGGWLGGRLAGFSNKDSFLIGIGLNGRGIMELVIANIALQNNYISIEIFSVLVLMGVTTTIVTPSLLKKYFV